jgi:ferrous iron transport protein A
MQIRLLRGLKQGETGEIVKVNSGGELGRRIRDMGLIPGASVRMEGPAPLNDPVAIRVHSFTLTLRNNEADFIEVAVEDRK